MAFFCCWMIIALLQLFVYWQIKDFILQIDNAPIVSGLGSTALLLILFQILRFASLKIQHQELVAPSRARYDIYDNRRVNFLDIILFFIYLGALVYTDLVLKN